MRIIVTASTITTGGSLVINANDNINIIGSNIVAEGDINLTTQEGNVNIVAAIDRDSVYHEETNSNSVIGKPISSEIDIYAHNNETIVSSNLTSGNSIIINSGNNINILGSNLTGTDGNLTAQNNINIMSVEQINQTYTFHQETHMSLSAIMVGAVVGATVGALTAGAGFFLIASSLAGASQGANAQEGYAEGTLITTINNISSNLNFGGNLEITTQEGNVNLVASHLTAESININLNGENSSLNLIEKEDSITTETQHVDIKPAYLAVSAFASIAGAYSALTPTTIFTATFPLINTPLFNFNNIIWDHALDKDRDWGLLAPKPVINNGGNGSSFTLYTTNYSIHHLTESSNTNTNTIYPSINSSIFNINYNNEKKP